jgi:hypothetical protein
LIGDTYHSNGSPRSFVEAMEGWEPWIKRRVSPKTVQRYACSLEQLRDFLDGRRLSEIDGRLERIPVMFEHSRHGERSSCILAG